MAGAETRKVEHIGDQVELQSRVVLDGGDHLRLFLVEASACRVGQYLHVADDDVERCAQLVRDGGEELGLEPVRPLQLPDLLLPRSATAREALDHRVDRAGMTADPVARSTLGRGAESA